MAKKPVGYGIVIGAHCIVQPFTELSEQRRDDASISMTLSDISAAHEHQIHSQLVGHKDSL